MSMSDDDLIKRLGLDREVPVPPATLQRWRRALDAAAQPAATRRPFAPSLRFATAALVLVAGFGIAFVAFRDGTGTAPDTSGPLAEARFERALQWHLLELQSQLEAASDQPAAERAGTIRRLAEQNRLQTAVAERAGGTREARVLRAFTVALEDLAADPQPNGAVKGEIAQLDFEVKVMQARLASSSPSTGARALQAL